MATLYRQYRPSSFGQIYGQDHITGTLQTAIEKDRVAHAYLFHGPRGTGKTTTARILAKRLNCQKPKGNEPCGKCKVCQATASGANLDIIEIDAASNRGIDDIRALRDSVGLSPALGKYKVYIIDEVHMLTGEAFAALLKTLEEPVKHAIFILATTEFHKVPATILSRCQVYRFRRAGKEEMSGKLKYILEQEKREIEPEALDFIIERSDGCYRDAESLLGQVLGLSDGQITLDSLTELLGLPPAKLINSFMAALVAGESAPAIAAADEAFEGGIDPEQFLREAIVAGRNAAVSLAKQQKPVEEFASHPQAGLRLPQILRTLLQASQDLAYVPQPMIAIHLAIVTLCASKGAPASTAAIGVKPAAAPVPQRAVELKPARAETPKQEARVVSSVNAAAGSATGGPEIEKIRAVWPQLIDRVKTTNPVASTFLRAIEPVGVEGQAVKVQAHYALHRSFFEKPENRGPVEKILSELIQSDVSIRCFMAEAGPATAVDFQQKQRQQEEELLKAVKQAFG